MSDPDDSLPDDVIDEALRLTRLAREAVDPAEADAHRTRRETVLAEHGFRARIREDDTRTVLVLYPVEWMTDGQIDVEAIENTDRAIERPLSGPGVGDAWKDIDRSNRELATSVQAEHGDPHGATATALADFASNHYAKPIEQLTPRELEEFRTEYFPRNAWPSDEQMAALDRSLELIATHSHDGATD